METCLPCSNYTGGASLLSLLRGIVLPLILLCFIYSQRLAQQSSVSLHGILCQPHSSLHKLVLENEPGPSVRCRVMPWKVRVLCSYFRGEAKQKQMQEKEEWEQKQEKATDHSQRLRAKKITGCFYIPKPWPLSLEPEMSNLYWKLVWPFTFTRVRMWIMNVDTLLTTIRQVSLASRKRRCHISAEVALLSTTTKTARTAELMITCYNWGQARRQVLSNSIYPAAVKPAPDHRVA